MSRLCWALALTAILAADLAVAQNSFNRSSQTKNLLYNGSFEHPEKPMDGWMSDYQWMKNSHYMNNHTRVSHLDNYQGRKNVMFINGTAETKVESKPFKFERDARYKVSVLHNGSTNPHIYLMGYQFKPGKRPHEDPHIGDLRPRYKSTWRDHKVTKMQNGWRKSEFEVPMKNVSELAMKHLKPVRYFTVYIVVVDGAKGTAYIDDVEVTRIQ